MPSLAITELVDPAIGISVPPEAVDLRISGLSEDSRKCCPGFLFAAVPGSASDGREYISGAIARGASCVLTVPGVVPQEGAVFLYHGNPRYALGRMAAKFHGAQPEYIAAVTGTNGKSSVVHFCRQLWALLGRSSASIGTLGVYRGMDKLVAGGELTTPDVVLLHETLAALARDGINRVALEASSHGLDQWRLAGVKISAGAITNITRDHLDYHGSFERYREAKWKLFSEVMDPGGTSVINADAPECSVMAERLHDQGRKVITYGKNGDMLLLLEAEPNENGQRALINAWDKVYSINFRLFGEFQIYNLLCAIGLVESSGIAPEEIMAVCHRVTAVPGRMQEVARRPSGASVIVDYAHTPDALEKVLQALRPHAAGRLSVIFGCGGNRDAGKRPIMGRIAAQYADLVTVTDDNPRFEDAASIRREVLSGCPDARESGDRAAAIRLAMKELRNGDILLIAGKGHETYQIIGDKKIPHDDAAIAREAAGEI